MLSREFLLERGYCCGHGCLMCPYEPKHIKNNTDVAQHCKLCEKNKEIAGGYVICFDCLFELDINHKNYNKYRHDVVLNYINEMYNEIRKTGAK